jgi:hypothetical protein
VDVAAGRSGGSGDGAVVGLSHRRHHRDHGPARCGATSTPRVHQRPWP